MVLVFGRTQQPHVLLLYFLVPVLVEVVSHILVQVVEPMHVEVSQLVLQHGYLFSHTISIVF